MITATVAASIALWYAKWASARRGGGGCPLRFPVYQVPACWVSGAACLRKMPSPALVSRRLAADPEGD